MHELYLRYKAISVFADTASAVRPLAELTIAADDETRVALAAEVFRAVAQSGYDSTGEWIKGLVLADDNPFSRAAARGERISDRMRAQVKIELLTLKQLSFVKPVEFETADTAQFFPEFGFGGFSLTLDGLEKYYAKSGCGVLGTGDAFIFSDGRLCRAENRSARLSDLMDYAEEKNEVVRNTQSFADGLPAFHTLLYGDRGTGKSTTVRAVANEFRGRLKIIEIARGDVGALQQLIRRISGLKQKFILFIDDLAFDPSDDGADGFKTALEGSLGSTGGNYLIYCTSNRRHLFREADAPRQHASDEKQAELALFDRFGLVVTYINPDKDGFVSILKQILRSRGIKWREEYASVAELAALKKGGRSPRAAAQIADVIECTYAEKRSD